MRIKNSKGNMVTVPKDQEELVRKAIKSGNHSKVSKMVESFSKMANGGNINTTDKGWEFIPYDEKHKDYFRGGGLTADTKTNNGVMPYLYSPMRDGGLTADTKFNNGVMPYMMSPMYTGGMMVAGNAPFKEFTGTLGDVPIAGRTRMDGFRDGGLTANTKFWTGTMPILESHGGQQSNLVGSQDTGYNFTNKNPQTGDKGPDYFHQHKYLYDDRVSHGYKGQPEIGQIQKWDVANHPDDVYKYMQGVRPNNKMREIWKSYGADHTDKNIDPSKMSRKDILKAYQDGLSDYRAPQITDEPITPGKLDAPITTPQQGDSTQLNLGIENPGWQASRAGRGSNFNVIPIPVPDLYSKVPIDYRSINPNLIPYRPGSNEGELSELNRTTRGLSRFLQHTSEGIGEAANLQANNQSKVSDSFGKLYQDNQRQKLGVDEANQRELTEVDKYNTTNFLGQDKYRMERDYNNLSQGREDALQGQGRIDRLNQFQNTADWYGKTMNPLNYYNSPYSFSPEEANAQQSGVTEKDKTYSRDAKGRPLSTKEVDKKPTVAYGGMIKSKNIKLKKVKK